MNSKQVLAKNIQKYMDRDHLKAADVCKALGFKQNTFSNWLTGTTFPRQDKIEKMAEFFGCSPADLLNGNVMVVFDSRSDAYAMRIAEKAAQLSIEQQHQVMDFIAYLKGKNK